MTLFKKRFNPDAANGFRAWAYTVIALILMLAGCASQGKLRLLPADETRITLPVLRQNWKDYLVYYSTRVVAFDPIEGERTLEFGAGWIFIENSEKLAEILDRLQFAPRFDPGEIYEILGPEGDSYGFILFARGDLVSVRKVNAKTLRVYYHPSKPPDAP